MAKNQDNTILTVSKKNRPKDLSLHEVVIIKGLGKSDSKLKSGLRVFDNRISETQKARFLKNLKLAENKITFESAESIEDGSSTLVVFPPAVTAFSRNKFTRTFFSTLFKKKTGEFLVDLTHLAKTDQEHLLRDICVFYETHKWEPTKFSRKKETKKTSLQKLIFVTTLETRAAKKSIEFSKSEGRSINLIRTLADLPGNKLNPLEYRKLIKKRAALASYKYSFLGQSELEKKKAGAFLAVTQGLSKNQGGIVHLSQKSKPTRSKGKIILVGKGICFDTGGYNLKTGSYMSGMHRDMGGSALALGLFETLILTNPQLEIHAYLALAENIVSENAYRPSDLVEASNGVTIEVVDTDAEGRMVLADTLALSTKSQSDLTMTFATLTGAAVNAVGTKRGAVFSKNNKLHSLFFESSDSSGERVWPFPVGEEYEEGLKSEVADTLQCSNKRGGDHIFAATFLSKFIENDLDWVHMDLSADTNPGGLGLTTSDTTGFGLLWSVDFINKYFGVKK